MLTIHVNGQTHTLDVPPDFRGSAEEAFAETAVDAETFVVIASPSHHIDFTSVQAALRTPTRYIGMLGSRRKREALGTYLKQAGYGEEAIARVTTPASILIPTFETKKGHPILVPRSV